MFSIADQLAQIPSAALHRPEPQIAPRYRPVYDLLTDNRTRSWTSAQVAAELGITLAKASEALSVLYKADEITRHGERSGKTHSAYFWRAK